MSEEAVHLDAIDRRLLDVVQAAVPLEPRPFDAIARSIGIDEADCLARLRRLRDEAAIIRQISAIFDTRALGYESSLVGAQIAPQRLEGAAAIISGHPGVSHNYQREHELNLWFTLAVEPGSSLGLQGTVDRLRELTGAARMLLLPTLRTYKIGVRFDLSGDVPLAARPPVPAELGATSPGATVAAKPSAVPQWGGRLARRQAGGLSQPDSLPDTGDGSATPVRDNNPNCADTADEPRCARTATVAPDQTTSTPLDQSQRRYVRVLQQDLPLIEQPFYAWASEAGCDVPTLLAAANRFIERRQMRRFAAVLRHRKVGMAANVMVVWQALDDRVDEAGACLAQFDEVSHCYRRPTYPDWPYDLYTMVHARSRDAIAALLERMSAAAGIPVGAMLWSGREFKKQRVAYFTDAMRKWEAAHR